MNTQFGNAQVDESSNTAQTPDQAPPDVTIGRIARAVSVVLGGTLLIRGLERRSVGGAAMSLAGGWLVYRGISGHSRNDRREPGASATATEVTRSVTVGKPADELLRFWRQPENLTRIMGSAVEITSTGENRHRWLVRGPLGRNLSWETKVVEERPDELLRWESVDDSVLSNEGLVRFRPAPADRGTEVTLSVRFDAPGGAVGTVAMKRLNIVPSTLVGQALDRFKSLAETGEIPTLERNPSARGSGDLL